MKRNSNLTLQIIIIGIVFFVALSASRNYLEVSYSNKEVYTYENFYLSNLERRLDNTECGNSVDLADRHKLRWVMWKTKTQIYKIAKEFFGFAGAGAAFAIIHALIITFTYWYTQQNLFYCLKSISNRKLDISTNIDKSGTIVVSAIVFLTLFLYSFNGHVGEFDYSTTEALCISIALYSVLNKRILLFSIVTSVAILNRESGFLLLSLWVIFNGIFVSKLYKNLYFLLPPFVFIIANFPIFSCLFQDKFLVSADKLPGQITFHILFDGLWGFIRGILAILFNYIIIFLPPYIAYKWLSNINFIDSTIIKKIMLVIGLYMALFIVATPLQHMSVKFIMAPLISVLLSIYILGMIGKWKDIQKPIN